MGKSGKFELINLCLWGGTMRKLAITSILFMSAVSIVCGEIPFDNLQIWLQVDSVGSNSDFFLPSMRNMSNKRFAVNQVDLKYRPLYIRDFIQHRPAICLSDSRGFAFGTLRATEETAIYVGYYHEVAGRAAEFRIETFGPDDILDKTSKNGFVVGIYEGMLGFHGEPGYSSAFAEFIMYDRTLTAEQDRQIRSYLMGRYGLTFDSRYVRNSPAILLGSAASLSNVVTLKNKTMVCAAGVKQTEKRREQITLDLIRSYNHGGKWSQTIGQVLDADEYLMAAEPSLYMTSSGVLYCFYGEKQPDGRYKAAYKYSLDEGYNWSKVFYILNVVSDNAIRVAAPVLIGGQSIFCVSSSISSPILLISLNIDKETDPKNIIWKISTKPVDAVKAAGNAVFESVSLVVHKQDLWCFFGSTDGFVYQTVSADGGGAWSPVKKATYVSGRDLRNPDMFKPYPFIAGGKLMLCFRNLPAAGSPQRDTIWLSEAVVDGDVLKWSQPRVCVYSREHSGDASMQISYAVISDPGMINAAVMCGDSAYFSQVNMGGSVSPVGIGVLELKEGAFEDEFYNIAAVPSLIDGRIIINVDTAFNTLNDDVLLMRIGEDKNKIVLFTEKNRFGLYITDGYKSAVFKSIRYDTAAARSLMIDIDGSADIMRILVDGVSSAWDEGEGSAWVYFSAEIGRIMEEGQLFIPRSSHGYIKKLSLHYPELFR